MGQVALNLIISGLWMLKVTYTLHTKVIFAFGGGYIETSLAIICFLSSPIKFFFFLLPLLCFLLGMNE